MEKSKKNVIENPGPQQNKFREDLVNKKREELPKKEQPINKEEWPTLEKSIGYQPDSEKYSSDIEAELKARSEQEKEEQEETGAKTNRKNSTGK